MELIRCIPKKLKCCVKYNINLVMQANDLLYLNYILRNCDYSHLNKFYNSKSPLIVN